MSVARLLATRRLVTVLAVIPFFLTSCGDDETRTPTGAETPSEAPEVSTEPPEVAARDGEAILIRTHVKGVHQGGQVLKGSLLGNAAFCPGGTFLDKPADPSSGVIVVTTFSCGDGRLTVGFSPETPTRVQSSKWQVMDGTGRYAGMRGNGWMVAEFDDGEPPEGHETFTGVVATEP